MLSYRHAFHAGSFADVLKHLVLMRILSYLVRKRTALCYFDTHAGAGRYDLDSRFSAKTGEHLDGIGLLWTADALPPAMQAYVDLVRSFNVDGMLRRYPGSPLIAASLLRRYDRLELRELHPTDFALLEDALRGDRRVRCRQEDGFAAAVAALPPAQRRGLVFIDPSYEKKDDYERLCERLVKMYRRFATGVYALWYPVVDRRLTDAMKASVCESVLRDVLDLELLIEPGAARGGMRGCGLLVVNAPWTLRAEMEPLLHDLAARLAGPRPAQVTIRQLVPE